MGIGDVAGMSGLAFGLATGLIFLGMIIGGMTGFGSSLVTTPFLLLLGLPLPLIITSNLTLVIVTRLWVAWQGRVHLTLGRPLLLFLGSVPGLALGTLLLTWTTDTSLKRLAGGVILVAVAVQVWSRYRSTTVAPDTARPPVPGALLITGVLSGILGTTTSLNGVPPAILLTWDRLPPRAFQVNLAYFFVASNAAALLLLTLRRQAETDALLPLLLWAPIALAGNGVGMALGTRLPVPTFRAVTYGLVAVAGFITLLTA